MKTYAILAAWAVAFAGLSTFAAAPKSRTLEVLEMETPPFPLLLLQRGVNSGEADAIVSIGADGKIVDWLVTAYTEPAFEASIGEILPTLLCKPPASSVNGGPTRVTLRFFFEATGVVISQTVNDTVASLMTRITGPQRIEKLGTMRQLDRALEARHTVTPRYSAEVSGPTGTRVTLEFLIDEAGRVRMPVLHKGENWQLANAAADALLDWQFAPPTRKGEPIIVAARQEFVFPPSP